MIELLTVAALFALAWVGWSLCRAAARMDRVFDDLDRELEDKYGRK